VSKNNHNQQDSLNCIVDFGISSSISQVEHIIAKLRTAIDELDRNFTHVKNLIQELAKQLDETKKVEQCHICRKIKESLRDKITAGKITEKWIEESLPPEYKRKYAKSERSSLSRNDHKEKIFSTDTEIVSSESYFNDSNSNSDSQMQILVTGRDQISGKSADGVCTQHQKLEELLHNTSSITSKTDLPIRFRVSKENYDGIRIAMHNNVNYFYMIFDAKTGLFLRSEPGETDR
jgi:hypothetical protein